MGTNTITEVIDTERRIEHHNQFFTALNGDVVPRSSGVPTDEAGDLGNGTTNWSKLYLGDSASGVTVESDSTPPSCIVKIDGTQVFSRGDSEIGVSVGRGGFALSSASTFSTTSTGFVDVTNLSVSIDLSGKRPVILTLVPYDGSSSYITVNSTSFYTFAVDGVGQPSIVSPSNVVRRQSPAVVNFYDISKPSGVTTYKIQMRTNSGVSETVNQCKLLVREL